MIVYHEISPSSVHAALRDGLKRTSRGAKGDDALIAKTDHYLDSCRPADLQRAGISRDDNLYAYVAHEDTIIDITDGQAVDIASFIADSKQAVLQLTINPDECYVSDLDAYDAVKRALETHDEIVEQLARNYWRRIRPLRSFSIDDIRRPEVMITCDIPPDDITVIKQ